MDSPKQRQRESATALMPWQIQLFRVEQSEYKKLAIENQIHPHWIISHVLHGEVEATTLNDRQLLRSGDVMIHPSFVPFSEKAAGPGTHQWLMLDLRTAQNVEFFHRYPVSLIVRLPNLASFTALFSQLMAAWKDDSAVLRHVRISVLVLQIVELLVKIWMEAGSVPRPEGMISAQSRFMPVIEYMNNRLHEKLSRETLAGLLHLNANYLDRAFAEAYGITPMQMLRDMRIRRAKLLLETTGEPLDAVAVRCGVGNAAYLNRIFLKNCGMTPGQYRENIGKSPANRIY